MLCLFKEFQKICLFTNLKITTNMFVYYMEITTNMFLCKLQQRPKHFSSLWFDESTRLCFTIKRKSSQQSKTFQLGK